VKQVLTRQINNQSFSSQNGYARPKIDIQSFPYRKTGTRTPNR